MTALGKWYATLANRHAAIASVVVIGDSNSEGTGVTSIRRRWQQVLQAQLRARFQPAGVTGATVPFIPSTPRLTPVPSDYGVTVSGATQQSYGLGLKAAAVVAGQSVTFTATGTRLKLIGTKGGAVGKYSIVLNGAPEVVVDGVQASTAHGQVIWDSGPLTAGAHMVVVTRAASTTLSPGTVYPEGLMVYNGDEAAGVRVVDGSRHGLKISAFNQNPAWQTPFGAVEGKGLLIMPWGANDATGGTTAAVFRTDLETLIGNARAAGFAGSILLVKMPKRGAADAQLWADYLTQIDLIAAGDPDIATLDLRARIPDYGTAEATALGIYADEVHYNDKGHGMIADEIAKAIFPAPIGSLVYDPVLSRVRINVEEIAPTVLAVDVARSTDQVRWSTVRGGLAVPVSGGVARLDDYEFAPGVVNYYRVGDHDGSVVPVLDSVWLKSIARPFLNRPVTVRDFSEVTRPSRAGVFEVVGRSYPVAVTDLRSSRRWTLDVSTYSPEDADVLDLLAASGDILLVHVPAGTGRLSATPGGYVTVGDTREVTPPTVDLAMRVFTLPCVEVAAPGPDVVGATATCQTVLSTYATCTAVLAAHPTCVSLMELVADPEDVIVS